MEPGATQDILLNAKNTGGMSPDGFLSVSVSDGLEVIGINGQNIDPDTYSERGSGDYTYFNYPVGDSSHLLNTESSEKMVPLNQLVEAAAPYQHNTLRTFSITVRAKEGFGASQWIKHRFAMANMGYSLWDYRAPIGGVTDQQGWHAAEIGISVNVQPIINLTLYRISLPSGLRHSVNPGPASSAFNPGDTVRVTLKAENTGAGGDIDVVCNLLDHAGSDIDYICYNSNDPAKTSSGTVDDYQQPIGTGGVRYFSFDYVLPKWAPSGHYDVMASARDGAEWDIVLDTSADGPDDEDFDNAWLEGSFNVSSVHSITVPILMYHKIDTPPHSDYWITPEIFAEQMAALTTYGYTPIDVDDLMNIRAGTASPPQKPVILTFDDGYRNHHDDALPVLQQEGLKGVFSIITNRIASSAGTRQDSSWDTGGNPPENTWPAEHLIWAEVTALRDAGMAIASHSKTHPDLTILGEAQLTSEIGDSKTDIEAHLGGDSCGVFCYPGGSGTWGSPEDSAIQAKAREKKYHGALAAGGGAENTGTCNPFALQRIEIRNEHSVHLDPGNPANFFMRQLDSGFPVPDIAIDSIEYLDAATGNPLTDAEALQGQDVVISVTATNRGSPVMVSASLNLDSDSDHENGLAYDSHQTSPP
jgi:peptidoglycan/xylan/chitin deacetylase (PgdA/CDA1 family)